MKAAIIYLMGLVGLWVPVGAAPWVEGRVRLDSGKSVAAAQVQLFDLSDLPRGAIARATTDETGHFALPLAALGGTALPHRFTLGQNYPNPFNPSTIIPYQLAASTRVRLEVFNVLGQRLATLVDEEQAAGSHTATWNATDAAGRAVGAGVYFYRLRGGGKTLTGRMVLVDGQAGIPKHPIPATESPTETGTQVYGLTVSGEGLVAYVNPDFRVQAGMAPLDLVVTALNSVPRAKVATTGILGDVTNDGLVDLADALVVMLYISESSTTAPNGGDLTLGDINGDSQINLADVLIILMYIADPFDPALPAGIGAPIGTESPRLSNLTQSTDADDQSPVWSPDGQHITFTSYYRDDNNRGIYVMDADGHDPRNLTQSNDAFNGPPVWSPDGQHIAFQADHDIYVMDADGENLRNLTQNNAFNGAPVWSPDGQHIAFHSYRDGNYDIYVMDADGKNLHNLTQSNADDQSPVWSPDGQYIAFQAYRDDNADIYVMDADGKNPRNLTQNPAFYWAPVWSPDGQYIAFQAYRDDNWDIYVMDADGKNLRNLTQNSSTDEAPVWSPDGQHIAFTSNRDGNRDIYVMDADGENLRNLTQNNADDQSPVWSPDGQYIAFTSGRGDNRDIWLITLRGRDGGSSEPPRLSILPQLLDFGIEGITRRLSLKNVGGNRLDFVIESPVDWLTLSLTRGSLDTETAEIDVRLDRDKAPLGDHAVALVISTGAGDRHEVPIRATIGIFVSRIQRGWSPVWSPDGQHIAFHAYNDGNYDIYVMDADGKNPRNLTQSTHRDGVPVWSPNGQHIAFTSERDDNRGIYVMDADGKNLRNLIQKTAYDASPVWSPDSQHIAFESDEDIYVMDADGKNLRNLTQNTAYAYDASPVWSPDSQHIAFTSGRADNYDNLNYGIYVMDADGENLRNLTQNIAYDASPAWSPDGQHIAFTSGRYGNRDIYVMDADGENLRNLTQNIAYDAASPVWSPDSQHIAFESYHDDNYDIYMVDADGENLRNLTQNTVRDRSPVWSPDGQHIAFTSNGVVSLITLGGEDSSTPTDGGSLTNNEPPRLSILPQLLDFGTKETTRRLSLKNVGGSRLDFVIEPPGDWITLSLTRGSLATETEAVEIDVRLDRNKAPLGDHAVALVITTGAGDHHEVPLRASIGIVISRLTQGAAVIGVPVWSPDGQYIAFHSYRDHYDGNTYVMKADNIYVMDADGENPRNLTQNTDNDVGSPVWSPGEQHIAFHSKRSGSYNHDIYVMDADGENPRNLTQSTDNDDGSPVWSPDGQYIAFHSRRDDNPVAFTSKRYENRDIYVMDADGENPRNLTQSTDNDDGSPVWSPNGQYIAFHSRHEDNPTASTYNRYGKDDIYVMDADGENPRNLTQNPDAHDWEPVWSPDGQYIAFISYHDDNYDIYVMDADGENPRNLTQNTAYDSSPVWSPDGQYIAFTSDREGNDNIYVMDADGHDLRNLTQNTAYDSSPVWSPDGQHIAFISKRDGDYDIWLITFRRGP